MKKKMAAYLLTVVALAGLVAPRVRAAESEVVAEEREVVVVMHYFEGAGGAPWRKVKDEYKDMYQPWCWADDVYEEVYDEAHAKSVDAYQYSAVRGVFKTSSLKYEDVRKEAVAFIGYNANFVEDNEAYRDDCITVLNVMLPFSQVEVGDCE